MIIKKNIYSITFFLVFFIFLSSPKAELNIVVKIDNEIITNYDIKSKILSSLLLANKEINQKNINDLKKNALDFLIQNKLKKIELEKYNLKRDSKQINAYLNSISSNNISNLKKLFKNYDIDFNSFESEVDIEMKWKNFIYNNYSKKIEINPKDIDDEIQKKIKGSDSVTKYFLSEIEILKINDESDQRLIFQVKEEIKNNGFENAVLKYSVSPTSVKKGELGWVNSDALSKEFSKVIKELKIGEVSAPIERQGSILFLKLIDKQVSDYTSTNIDLLKKDLINQKKNELFNLYSKSHLSKLKNTKFIEYFDAK